MIFVDASIPRSVAQALQKVREDVLWIDDVPDLSHATPDSVWLRRCGAESWLAITRDKKIRTRPAERRAVTEGGVGLFVLAHRKNLTRWEQLRTIVTHLDDMEACYERTVRPFIVNLGSRGLSRYL